MAAVLDGEALKTFGKGVVDCVRLIPDDKRDAILWEGKFPDAQGNLVEKKAQSVIVIAADAAIGLHAMAQMLLEKKQGDAEYMEWVDNEIVRISKLPTAEVADLMQQYLDEAAEALDSVTPEVCEETIIMEGQPFTKKTMASLVFGHMVHHRGQLYMLLRWLGVTPPHFFSPPPKDS